jgi:hypothetical protein
MVKITKQIVYYVDDTFYSTFDKAKDAAEDKVVRMLDRKLKELGFTANEVFKLATVIIGNRKELLKLLDFPGSEEECDERQDR